MKRIHTKGIRLLMAVILLVSMVAVAKGAAQLTSSTQVETAGYTVVIDAGHGGNNLRVTAQSAERDSANGAG